MAPNFRLGYGIGSSSYTFHVTPHIFMKVFTKKTSSSSRRPQDSLLHRISNDPYLDWRIMVVTSTICAGIIIGLGFLSYGDTEDRLLAPVVSDTGARPVLFDAESMSKILKTFDDRATEQSALMKRYSGVADPSL